VAATVVADRVAAGAASEVQDRAVAVPFGAEAREVTAGTEGRRVGVAVLAAIGSRSRIACDIYSAPARHPGGGGSFVISGEEAVHRIVEERTSVHALGSDARRGRDRGHRDADDGRDVDTADVATAGDLDEAAGDAGLRSRC
jgi:hypothetical protein